MITEELLVDVHKGKKPAYKQLKNEVTAIIVKNLGKFSGFNNIFEDLISEGMIETLKASETFDSSKSKFSTYVYRRLRARMYESYFSLTLPYGAIKSLMRRPREKWNTFRESERFNVSSVSDLLREEVREEGQTVYAYEAIRDFLNPYSSKENIEFVLDKALNNKKLTIKEKQELENCFVCEM